MIYIGIDAAVTHTGLTFLNTENYNINSNYFEISTSLKNERDDKIIKLISDNNIINTSLIYFTKDSIHKVEHKNFVASKMINLIINCIDNYIKLNLNETDSFYFTIEDYSFSSVSNHLTYTGYYIETVKYYIFDMIKKLKNKYNVKLFVCPISTWKSKIVKTTRGKPKEIYQKAYDNLILLDKKINSFLKFLILNLENKKINNKIYEDILASLSLLYCFYKFEDSINKQFNKDKIKIYP